MEQCKFEEFQKIYDELVERKRTVLIDKGHDYSDLENFFGMFERVANVSGVSPEQEFLVFLCTKIERLSELINKGEEAKFESKEDTLLDLSNYADMMYCYLQWLQRRKEKPF